MTLFEKQIQFLFRCQFIFNGLGICIMLECKMEKIAYSKKIKKRPKWLETFHVNFMKNFPDCSEDLSQSLLEILNNKVKDVSTRHYNRKKLKALFEIVRDLFLHFYWKIRWKGKKMWRKYWEKDYSKTFSYDFRTKCVAKLLYFIIYIGIKLSKGASDSRWISRILQAVHILPDYSIVYTSLLMVHKLKKKYHRSYCAILKKVLIIKFPKCILDPVVYIKIMILFRRLKYLEDANEKREIQSAALKFQAPSNLIPWMTFNLDVSKVKHKRIAQRLFKKSSRDLFKKLEQIVTDFESLSSVEWSKDTKRTAENIDSQVDLDSTLNFFHSSRDLKIEEKKSISPKMKKHKPKKKSKNKRKNKSNTETAVNLDETHSLAIEKCNENVNLGLTPSSQTTINGTSFNLDDTNSLAFHEACNKNVNLSLQPSSQKLDTLLCNPAHKLNAEDCQVPLSSEKNEAITENNIIIAKTEKRKTFSLSKKLSLGKTLKTSRKKIKLFNNDEFESSRKLVEMHPNNEVVSDVNEPAKIASLSISTNMNSTHDVNTLQALLNFPKGKMMSSHNKTTLNIFSVSEVREKSCGKTVVDMVANEQVYSHDDADVSLYNTCSAPLFDSMPDSSADMGNSFEASINNSTQVHSNLNNSFSNNSLEAKILYKKTSVSEDTCGRDKNDANTVYDKTIDHIAHQTSTHLMQDLNVINPDSQITADNLDLCRDDSVITREEHFNFENNAKTFEQLCNSFNSVTNWVSNSTSDSVPQNAPMQNISCIGIESVRFSESQNLNETGAMCKNTVKVGANEFTFPQREGMLHQSTNATGDQNTFVIDCNIVNNASNHTQSETMSKNPEISSIKVIINLNNKKHSDSLLLQNEHHAGNSKLTTKSLSSHASANSFTDHFNVSQKTGSSSQVVPKYNGYRSSSHEGNYSRNDEHYSGNNFSRQPANNYTSSKNRSLSGKTYRNSATDIYSDDSCDDISVTIMGVTSDEDTNNSFIKALGGHSSSESPLKNKNLGSNNHSRMRTISPSTFEYHSNAEMFNLNGDKTSNFKRPLTPKCRTSNPFEKAKIVRRKANKTVDRNNLPQKTVTTVKPCDKISNFKRPLTPKCRTSNPFEKAKIVRRKANKTVDRNNLPQKTVTTVKPCAYNLRSRKSISKPSNFNE